MKKTLIVIAGPTAVGKSKFALELALELKSEIFSADSRQFYKGMSVGTAAPEKGDLDLIKHHYIQFRDPDEHVSAGQFESMAIEDLGEAFIRNPVQILVGGSGLFLDAVMFGFHELPQSNEELRHKIEETFETKGIEFLQRELKDKDPEFYQQVDIQNPRRLIRALEVMKITGQTISSIRSEKKEVRRNFRTLLICLNCERSKLNRRIETRVDEMVKSGLVEETRALLKFRESTSMNTLGYKEIIEFLDGKISLEQAVEDIKSNTRKFAKKQLTWFKRYPEAHWFDIQEIEEAKRFVFQTLGGKE